jgi:hypothetical protein
MVIRCTAALVTALCLTVDGAGALHAQSLVAIARPPKSAPSPQTVAPARPTAQAPAPSTAGGTTQAVEVLPAFRAGDEFRLQVTHTRENTSRPQQNATITTPVQVRVLSTGAQGTVLEWIPGIGKTSNAQMAADPVMQAALKAAGNMPLRLSLDTDGELQGLLNETEVLEKLQAAVRILTDAALANVPTEGRANIRNVLDQVLSPRTLLMSAMRDPQTYFGLNGAALDVGNEVEIDVQQPNPFGPTPLPATLWVKAESATPDAFVIVTKTTYDRDALTKMTSSLLTQAGAPLSAAEAKVPSMDMRDDGRYVFERTSGLAREVVVGRVAAIGPERRTDQFEIRMVQAPKR